MEKNHNNNDLGKVTENDTVENFGGQERGVDTECGYGSWKPKCLQRCHNAKSVLMMLTTFTMIQGFVVNGINNSNTTSLERRFGFSSLEVSFISAAYDISAGLFVIPIGYFGRNRHKPRWLATACLVMAIGSCVMFLPHFITGKYEFGHDAGDLCTGNATICSSATDLPGGKFLHLAIFIIGQMMHGIGGTTLYTLGLIWLDDGVKVHHLSLYIGIMEAGSALGPAIGFVVGGLFLDFFVDMDVINTAKITITPSDPRWVGAWWIGFLIAAALALICSLLLYCFGWEIPGSAENRLGRISQAHNDGSEAKAMKPGFGMTLKDMPKALWLLLKNPTFMFLNLSGVTATLLVMAYATFMPKFVQNQFQQTASWSALLTGFVAIPGIAGGQLMGGIIPAKMKLRVRGMIILSIIFYGFCVLFMPALFARCSASASVGVNIPYGNISSSGAIFSGPPNLTAPCNADCACSTRSQDPVCGADGREYFSGCFAGCTGYTIATGSDVKNFTGCACIAENLGQSTVQSTAISSLCPANCGLLTIFCVGMFFVVFCMSLPLTPLITVTLRVVPDTLRGYAIAIQWVFIRFFGSFPGPILFGFVLDSSCTIWQDNCGERGSCWMYDSFRMAWTAFVFSVAMGLSSLIFMGFAVWVYKPPMTEEIVEITESREGILSPNQEHKEGVENVTAPSTGSERCDADASGKKLGFFESVGN